MPKEINDWVMGATWREAVQNVREDMMRLNQQQLQFATREELQAVQSQVTELASAVQSIPTAEAIGEAVAARLGEPSIPPIERARMRLEGWKLVAGLLIAVVSSGGIATAIVSHFSKS